MPQSLECLFGAVTIGYGTLPRISKCNMRSCRRQANPLLTVSYRFPSWLIGQTLVCGFISLAWTARIVTQSRQSRP